MLAQQERINQSLMGDGISPNNLSEISKSYSEGELDGKINLNPSHLEDWNYWSGYSQSNRGYWCRGKGITLADDF